MAFLGSLWFAHNYSERRLNKDLMLSVLLYALALGAKEIGIVCLPVYYLILSSRSAATRSRKSLIRTLLVYTSIAAGYFLARLAVLGAITRPPENAVPLGAALLSLPSMCAFYLRTASVVAERMNAMPKVVFSRTLDTASWNNTELVKSGPAAKLRELKQQAGNHMTILGSGNLVAQLAEENLIDEYQFVIVPVMLGAGGRCSKASATGSTSS